MVVFLTLNISRKLRISVISSSQWNVFSLYFLSYLKKINAHSWGAWFFGVTKIYELRVSFKMLYCIHKPKNTKNNLPSPLGIANKVFFYVIEPLLLVVKGYFFVGYYFRLSSFLPYVFLVPKLTNKKKLNEWSEIEWVVGQFSSWLFNIKNLATRSAQVLTSFFIYI